MELGTSDRCLTSCRINDTLGPEESLTIRAEDQTSALVMS